jgi:TolB-like protein
MSRIVTFFRELRERRLFQVLVSYLAAGWLVLQVLDQLQGHALIADVYYRLGLLWYVVGIPAVLVVGWNHGEKGKQRAPVSEIVVLVILLVGTVSVSGMTVSKHMRLKADIAAVASGAKLQHVAVLYFQDLTPSRELDYLADGLTEDLIRDLSRVSSLDVVTRNGVAQFRGKDLPVDSIASALSAGTVVAGTVERDGDRVRVNVRLMDQSGADIDRAAFVEPASEIFAIRDELAKETSELLRRRLGEEIRLRELRHATRSPEAWSLYARAEKALKDARDRAREDDEAGTTLLFDRADGLLAQAELLDPAWVEPTILRGEVAYRRARLAGSADDASALTERGLQYAERALSRAPSDPSALELRGTIRYYRYVTGMEEDDDRRAALLRSARADLERAVEVDPSLASAYSTLSHLYYHDNIFDAVIAAQKAYEEDAYLDVANEVLWRLFLGNYDTNNLARARDWCQEGARRFASDYRFTECRLWVMTTPDGTPDPAGAWALLSSLDTLTPPPLRAYERARGELVVGGVLARAGLADSARTVLARAHEKDTPEADPTRELEQVEAYMRTLIGDNEGAIALLKKYRATHADAEFDHHWWWADLRSDPSFRLLLAAR